LTLLSTGDLNATAHRAPLTRSLVRAIALNELQTRCPLDGLPPPPNKRRLMARVTFSHPREDDGPVLEVALSERNLIVLLSKLYTPGSQRTIHVGDKPAGLGGVILCAETDDEHYASPTRRGAPAGPMHPISELVTAVVKRVLTEEPSEA
jgi:hypothetical protein